MESEELVIRSASLELVYNDLQVVRSEGTSSLAAHAVEIMAQVCVGGMTPDTHNRSHGLRP